MTHSSPNLASQFPNGMQSSAPNPRCCCGRDYCAYLEYNDAALRSLEKDLQTAAEAGQVGASAQLCLTGTVSVNPLYYFHRALLAFL